MNVPVQLPVPFSLIDFSPLPWQPHGLNSPSRAGHVPWLLLGVNATYHCFMEPALVWVGTTSDMAHM